MPSSPRSGHPRSAHPWSDPLDGAGPPPTAAAVALVRPHVRVLVDWDRLATEATVRRGRLSRPGGTDGWWTPWYHCDGHPVGHDHPGAVPLAVRGALAAGALDPAHRRTIGHLARQMEGSTARFTVVTYTWDGATHVVLDGNHRLCAALAARCPLDVDHLEFRGPLDPTLVCDSRWFATGAPARR